MKILFLFTAKYPYGKGDSFVENEMPFLAKTFDKIIVISNECNDPQTKSIPQNAIIERIPYELTKFDSFASIFGIFSRSFWNEMSCVKKVYEIKLNAIIIKTALISLRKSKVLGKEIAKKIQSHSKTSDTIYAYSYWSNDMAIALAGLKPTFPQIKMISRAHGWDVYFEANLAQYLPFRQMIFTRLDAIYFISNKGLQYYLRYFPELQHKLHISRLGVSKQLQSNNQEFHRENIITIVSCSHVLRIKRVHLIAEALSEITNTAIHWIHFGDGDFFDRLKIQSNLLLLSKPNISFEFPGNVSNDIVLDYLRKGKVDLLLNVSSTEGIPVSIMEAMSFGIPAMATNVGGTSEIVLDGENGIMLSPNPTNKEIADKLVSYSLMTESEIQQLRDNAFKTWKLHYDSDNNYAQFIRQIL